MSAEDQVATERARRKREDADVEAHQLIDEPEENEAERRRKRKLAEEPDKSEAGRRRR